MASRALHNPEGNLLGYFSTTVLTPWVPEYRFVHYRSVMAITNASDKWESISASSSRFGRGFIGGKKVRWDEVSHGRVAPPNSERHLHQAPLPRLGGVAIYLSFLASVGMALLAGRYSENLSSALSGKTLLTILIPATLIFFLGICDDIFSIGPYAKVAVQAIAGALLFAGGLGILELPVLFGAHHFSRVVGLPITILWVIGITNAFNLIDGLDGLAAGSALFSTLVVFVVAISSHSLLVSLLTIALAGAILGFLLFNFK